MKILKQGSKLEQKIRKLENFMDDEGITLEMVGSDIVVCVEDYEFYYRDAESPSSFPMQFPSGLERVLVVTGSE